MAMGMVVILAVSLYTSMRIAFRAKASAEASVEPARTAEIAMEFMRNDLQNMIPPPVAANATTTTAVTSVTVPFQGIQGKDDRGRDADDLVYSSTADCRDHLVANGEIKQIELTVKVPNGTSDHCLVRRVVRNVLAQVRPEPEEEILCRGVAAFNARYYDGTQWLEYWDPTQANMPKLPAAVEVTLELERPDANNQMHRLRFIRVFPVSCSTAVIDATFNTGVQ